MLTAFECDLAHLAGKIRQPCEGALACRAGPLRKAVRASGSRTCKCSVLLALRRISSSPGAATSRSRRDKRSAPISSEKWASYSQAPPSAGRRAALAAGGSGGPGAGWRGQRRAGAGTGGLARRLVDVQCAALLCVWRPGGRPPGQGCGAFACHLPDGNKKRLTPYLFGFRRGDRMRAGLATPGSRSTRWRFRWSDPISGMLHSSGVPPKATVKAPLTRPRTANPARPAAERRRGSPTIAPTRGGPLGSVPTPHRSGGKTQDGLTATRRNLPGPNPRPRTAPSAPPP
jgi:hypothetical protein